MQEVRWPHDGWIKKKKYVLLYSGQKPHRDSMAQDSLLQVVRQCILGFEPINERMCKLRIKGKFYNMTIISVYAPTEAENKRNAEDVESFYNKLSDVLTKHQEMMP